MTSQPPHDPPDEARVGDFEWNRPDYEVIQTALRTLHSKLGQWNSTALEHGASASPYKEEVDDVAIMIEWGEPRLADKTNREIVVRGITVQSLRYIKAALLHHAWEQDAQIAEQAKAGWPPRVVESVRNRVRIAHKLADEIRLKPAAVLQELRQAAGAERTDEGPTVDCDVFVSHASEDKAAFVDELASSLRSAGLTVWYDAFSLSLGDSLRRSIDKGLARSRFGVVVLSPAFFSKEWPQRELDGLVSKESAGQKVVLPVWHSVDRDYIQHYSPTLADRVGISSARGIAAVVTSIRQAVGK